MDGETPPPRFAATALPRRISLLGGEVDLVTPADVLAFTSSRIATGAGGVVANHNLHSLHLLRRRADMRRFYATADVIEADSTPMILWGRLLGLPIGREHRCTYLDWREAFWARAAAEGWRVFYLGGEPDVAARGAAEISGRWPGVRVGVRHGHFDSAPEGPQNAAVLDSIRAFEPDVLFVGMGMPRQEAWILQNRAALGRCVIFPVGAAFDYEAGAIPTPPRWTGRLGIEWMFRLAAEPRRLCRRYLLEPWSLLGPALGDLLARARRRSAAAALA